MSSKKPPYLVPGGVIRKVKVPTSIRQSGPILSRFTVVWVQTSGVPFRTTNFFAQLVRNGVVVATAGFDPFGVARFNNITTLTTATFQLRAFNPFGVLQRVRTVPSGVEAFAIIG
ncbi:hypothetical protein [Paenibacillus sp. MMS18-CY102]|uniref:hypothetical protein n=1 Tax=Paenibacillus sp. MMS18-CY102 TaxID=2682849 RepID=UPI0013656D23|nr:hypothetical protein [Paenibacillus sp. MMS18-CY102]MWC31345.1 hypothetical protein [Paenibacillus sp. MMS18-CY102]